MQRSPLVIEQLNALALHLNSLREALLQNWRRSAEADPEMTTVSVLSRSQFHDHIPNVLDGFAHRLQARNEADKQDAIAEQHESAVGHGIHRWQQGYRQREVMYEWQRGYGVSGGTCSHLESTVGAQTRVQDAGRGYRPVHSQAFV